jgi:hypothetical protein
MAQVDFDPLFVLLNLAALTILLLPAFYRAAVRLATGVVRRPRRVHAPRTRI